MNTETQSSASTKFSYIMRPKTQIIRLMKKKLGVNQATPMNVVDFVKYDIHLIEELPSYNFTNKNVHGNQD